MPSAGKILNSSQLSIAADAARAAGKTIVHCHGVFDLLHIGHIRYFEEAKKFGDVLFVTLTADQYVNKGPGRPAFTEHLRAEALAALACVDYVSINAAVSAEPAIRAIRPAYYVKGADYKNRSPSAGGNLSKEEAAVAEGGGKLAFTEDIQFSSSKLINEFLNPLSDGVVGYIKDLRTRCSPAMFEELLGKTADLKVLVVGETIIDEYCFGEVIGKAGKEPVLVSRLKKTEKYAGGAVAIANHVAGFCNEVAILSTLGSIDSHEEFIRKNLKPNITPHFVMQQGRPTILKRRYLETSPLQKLFEVYVMDDRPLSKEEEEALCSVLSLFLKNLELVMVADYGHAMLNERAKQLLVTASSYLAVNTQVNAGNRGFHTISCYPRADYVSISESELRLDYRQREGEMRASILDLAGRMKAQYVTITRGKNGVVTFASPNTFVDAPAFDQAVIDRVGSGDAVLAVTSLLAKLQAPAEAIAFVADVAGSLAVRIIGHSSFISRSLMLKSINSLLK